MADSTGKACSGCGEVKPRADFGRDKQKRDGLTSRCKPCRRADNLAYQRTEQGRAMTAVRVKRWRGANPDSRREYIRANPDKIRQYREAYRSKYPDKDREYYEAHREQSLERSRRRRALKLGVTVGVIDADALWTGFCGICGQVMDRDLPYPDDMSKSLDHIVPLVLGGTHEQSNLQWAHLVCNKRKGAKAP